MVKKQFKNDSAFILKLVLYLIIGAQWIHLTNTSQSRVIPVPVGLVVGLIFASHEHFKIDRKLEYVVLLIAMFVGYWTQTGIYINLLR